MKNYKMGTYKLVRNKEGKFSSFKSKVKMLFRGFIKLSLVAFGGYMMYVTGGIFQPVAIATPVLHDNLTPKIEELKNKLVEDIRVCESKGYKESDAPIILDTNKKMSIGTFMYQKATVQHYSKKLYGKELTGKEATLLALDETQARQLTKDIIFKEANGWENWYTCGLKIKVEGRLQVINELSK